PRLVGKKAARGATRVAFALSKPNLQERSDGKGSPEQGFSTDPQLKSGKAASTEKGHFPSRDPPGHGENGQPMHARALLALPLILAAAAVTPSATAADAGVAALQVGLRSHGLYHGPIDGIRGRGTAKAIRRFQKRAHITVDGVVGPKTRRALGRFARHRPA